MVVEERAHLGEQGEAVGIAIALVGVREVLADVAESRGAEQRVDQGMRQHVRVGVPAEATRGARDLHAAEDQRPPLREAVRVVADARARAHPSGTMRRSRRSKSAISVTPIEQSISSARSYSKPR